MSGLDVEALLDQAAAAPAKSSATPPPADSSAAAANGEERRHSGGSGGRDRERDRDRRDDRDRRHRDDRDRDRRDHRDRDRRDRRSSRSRERDRRERGGGGDPDLERERHRRREDDRDRDRRGGGGGSRDDDRLENLGRRRQRSPSPDPLLREREEALRDDLTVLVQRIHPRADDFEIFEFFSQAGKVRDIRLIRDQRSNKSKGVGYVEFTDAASVLNALALNGIAFKGQPLLVQASMAEKNRLAQASKNVAAAATLMGGGGTAGGQPSEPNRIVVSELNPNISKADVSEVSTAAAASSTHMHLHPPLSQPLPPFSLHTHRSSPPLAR